MRALSLLSVTSSLVLLAACGGKSGDLPGTDTGTDGGFCPESEPPACVDQMILDLSLHDDKVSRGDVSTSVEGDDFVTLVDASAGGYQQASNNAWTYIRFEDSGATKLEIDDETALGSTDWHLAMRRFIVRVNSGDSGPSCVGAAALRSYTYEELTSVPDGISFNEDDYYTDDCTIVNDSSGLPGSPQVAMGAWWSYDTCVETTGTPFLIQLDDGRVVKLRIESFYGEDQADCNENGQGSDASGNMILRWTFME